MFSQSILNIENHILLSHKYGQVKLKLSAHLMGHNFSSDLRGSVSHLRACFVSCAIRNCCKSRESPTPRQHEAWHCLGLRKVSHSSSILAVGTGHGAPSQLTTGKRAFTPFPCREPFCYLFIYFFRPVSLH